MNKTQEIVKEFQETFGANMPLVPAVIDKQRGLARMIWTGEECVEFLAASVKTKEDFARLYYEFEDGIKRAYFKSLEANQFPQTEEEMMIAQTDAIGDQNIFVNGTALEMGIDLDIITEIIHTSNMSKLFTAEDGSKYVKYDENNFNKVMKSPEFFPPEEAIGQYITEKRKTVIQSMLKVKE